MQQPLTAHLQLQVAEHQQVAAVAISFMPTLADFIQQSFHVKEVWQDVRSANRVQQLWRTAAEVCGAQASIARSLADTSYLQALLAADPLHTIPSDQLLCGKTAATMFPHVLPQVEPPIRLLLLFTQLLITVTAEHKSTIANIPAPLHSEEGVKLLGSAITIKVQELTELSGCHTIMLPDIEEPQSHKAALLRAAEPSKTSRLRGTVLLTKLTMLTCYVQPGTVGPGSFPKSMFSGALGSVMNSLDSGILGMPAASTEAQPKSTHSSYDAKGNEEVQQLHGSMSGSGTCTTAGHQRPSQQVSQPPLVALAGNNASTH